MLLDEARVSCGGFVFVFFCFVFVCTAVTCHCVLFVTFVYVTARYCFMFFSFWVYLSSWVLLCLSSVLYVPPVSVCFDLGDSMGLGARQSLGGGAAGVAARGGA